MRTQYGDPGDPGYPMSRSCTRYPEPMAIIRLARQQDVAGALAISNAEAVAQCVNVIQLVHAKQYYKALVGCRKLFPFEEERLNYVAS